MKIVGEVWRRLDYGDQIECRELFNVIDFIEKHKATGGIKLLTPESRKIASDFVNESADLMITRSDVEMFLQEVCGGEMLQRLNKASSPRVHSPHVAPEKSSHDESVLEDEISYRDEVISMLESENKKLEHTINEQNARMRQLSRENEIAQTQLKVVEAQLENSLIANQSIDSGRSLKEKVREVDRETLEYTNQLDSINEQLQYLMHEFNEIKQKVSSNDSVYSFSSESSISSVGIETQMEHFSTELQKIDKKHREINSLYNKENVPAIEIYKDHKDPDQAFESERNGDFDTPKVFVRRQNVNRILPVSPEPLESPASPMRPLSPIVSSVLDFSPENSPVITKRVRKQVSLLHELEQLDEESATEAPEAESSQIIDFEKDCCTQRYPGSFDNEQIQVVSAMDIFSFVGCIFHYIANH